MSTNPQFTPNTDIVNAKSLNIRVASQTPQSIGTTTTYVGVCPSGGYGYVDGATFFILIGIGTQFTKTVSVGDYIATSAQTPPTYLPVAQVVSDTVILMNTTTSQGVQVVTGTSTGATPWPVASWGDGTGIIF